LVVRKICQLPTNNFQLNKDGLNNYLTGIVPGEKADSKKKEPRIKVFSSLLSLFFSLLSVFQISMNSEFF